MWRGSAWLCIEMDTHLYERYRVVSSDQMSDVYGALDHK